MVKYSFLQILVRLLSRRQNESSSANICQQSSFNALFAMKLYQINWKITEIDSTLKDEQNHVRDTITACKFNDERFISKTVYFCGQYREGWGVAGWRGGGVKVVSHMFYFFGTRVLIDVFRQQFFHKYFVEREGKCPTNLVSV